MVIKKSISYILLLIFLGLFLMISPVAGTIFGIDGKDMETSSLYSLTNGSKPDNTTSQVVFFFDPECGACKPAHEFMEKYISNHSGTDLSIVNLSSDKDANERLNSYYLEYNRSLIYIPVVFVGPVGLEGTDEIINGFEDVYNWYKN